MPMFTTKQGVELFYKDWGTGQPIVFHHGWPLSSDDWDAQMMFFLQKGYRVIRARPPRPTAARPRQDTDNTMDAYVDDAAQLYEALDLKDAIHVGHSTGGGEVARYVARFGQPQGRVAKAVLISSVTPVMVKTAGNPNGLSVEFFDGVRQQTAFNRAQFYWDFTLPFYGFNRDGAEVKDGVRYNWWRQGMMGGVKAHYDGIAAFSETDFTDDLKAITVPTLVMHGEDDQVVPFANAGPLAAGFVKGSVLEDLPGLPARHAGHPRRPDQRRSPGLHPGLITAGGGFRSVAPCTEMGCPGSPAFSPRGRRAPAFRRWVGLHGGDGLDRRGHGGGLHVGDRFLGRVGRDRRLELRMRRLGGLGGGDQGGQDRLHVHGRTIRGLGRLEHLGPGSPDAGGGRTCRTRAADGGDLDQAVAPLRAQARGVEVGGVADLGDHGARQGRGRRCAGPCPRRRRRAANALSRRTRTRIGSRPCPAPRPGTPPRRWSWEGRMAHPVEHHLGYGRPGRDRSRRGLRNRRPGSGIEVAGAVQRADRGEAEAAGGAGAVGTQFGRSIRLAAVAPSGAWSDCSRRAAKSADWRSRWSAPETVNGSCLWAMAKAPEAGCWRAAVQHRRSPGPRPKPGTGRAHALTLKRNSRRQIGERQTQAQCGTRHCGAEKRTRVRTRVVLLIKAFVSHSARAQGPPTRHPQPPIFPGLYGRVLTGPHWARRSSLTNRLHDRIGYESQPLSQCRNVACKFCN